MGRNRHSARIENIEQKKNDKKRDHDRELRNIRENKGSFVLHDRAGPTGQRMDVAPPVMTRVQIVSGMEMKTTGLGLLKIKKTGVTYKSCDEVNHNEKAGEPNSYDCGLTRL